MAVMKYYPFMVSHSNWLKHEFKKKRVQMRLFMKNVLPVSLNLMLKSSDCKTLSLRIHTTCMMSQH